MKISEYKNLTRFLTILFNFYKENCITSSIYPMDDYDGMRDRILDCEYKSISWDQGMYCVDFNLPERIEDGEVYMFISGNEDSSGISLIIDFGERGLVSFFNFSCDSEKHPPFLLDFDDDTGLITISSEVQGYDVEYFNAEDIMTFDEFIIYLNDNRKPKHLNMIVVD